MAENVAAENKRGRAEALPRLVVKLALRLRLVTLVLAHDVGPVETRDVKLNREVAFGQFL